MSQVPPSLLLKRVLSSKPWLFVVLYPLFGYRGLSIEELYDITSLSMKVVKRAVWWLKKLNILEEKSGKLYIKQEFYKPMENILYNYCKAKNAHVLIIEDFYIVIHVKSSHEVLSWSIQRSLYEKLIESEKFAGSVLEVDQVANILGIPLNVAKKLVKLRALINECREGIRSAEHSSRSS